MLDEGVLPIPEKLAKRLKANGVRKVHLSWEGGHDEAYFNVTTTPQRPELYAAIESWADEAWHYNGAGDGHDYGDNLVYDLANEVVEVSDWSTEVVDRDLPTEKLEIKEEEEEEEENKNMTFKEYQDQASQTAIYPANAKITYPALGLAGEAGEVANKAKKILRDSGGKISDEAREAISAEIGDVLWYLAALATDLDLNLSDLAADNIQKLLDRKARNTLQGSGDKR